MIKFDNEKILADIILLKAKTEALEEILLTDEEQRSKFTKIISEKTKEIMKETYGITMESDEEGRLSLVKDQ